MREIILFWLLIPSLNFYSPVYFQPLEDGIYDTTTMGPEIRWLEGTSPQFNLVIIGHNPGPFTELPKIREGDQLILISRESEYTSIYQVYHTELVETSYVEILNPRGNRQELTLITCVGEDRLIVLAKKVVESGQ